MLPLTPSLSPLRLCRNETSERRGNRVPKLSNAGLLGMGKHRWLEIECLHMVGDPESKRLKVAACFAKCQQKNVSNFVCREPCDLYNIGEEINGFRGCLFQK